VPPPQPYTVSGVAVGDVGQDHVDVSWKLSDPGGRVREVTVNWGTGGTFVNRAVRPAASGTYRITGLLPATSYTIDVAADAHDGTHQLGNQVHATTDPPPLPPTVYHSAPYAVAASAASTTAIDVSWAIDDPSGTLKSFTVNWGSAGTFIDRVTLGPAARSHRIEGLAAGTTYDVDVVAIGHDEASLRGPTVSATTVHADYSAPYAQTITPGPTFLDLTWAIDDPAGVVQQVTVNVGSNGTFVGRQVLPAGARSARFDGLTPATSYEVNVVAVVSDADAKIGPLLTATTTT
jgi:hypothetical protein